ncbi:MAG TPA: hypothetical protein VJM84_03485 [Actinomycetota bacterium]|nr:hypothetical protein [Actinomycetota bacterium]
MALAPAVSAPRRRRGLTAVVAVLTAIAIVGSLGVVGGVVNDLSRPRGSVDEYRFLATVAGKPVRWNPCAPIHYVINVSRAPDGSIEDVHQAVARMSEVTGVGFIYDGLTDEVPQRDRLPFQPERYGDGWAPVVIAWVSQSQTDIQFQRDDEYFAAVARPLGPSDGTAQFVSGWVVVNAADPNPPGWSYTGSQGPTVLHELGHVMGLDHVSSQAELMEPSGGSVTDFGPGDLAGLELLGRDQGCLVTPTPVG